MLDTTTNPWTKLSTDTLFDNPWIRLELDQVIKPSGSEGTYSVVRFKNKAIGIIPIDTAGNTYLVGQYRYALDEYSWEIPMGGGPENETPIETAHRELHEETGLRAQKMDLLLRIHTSNCVTDEEGFVFVATNLEEGNSSPDDTEVLSVWKLPVQEAIQMAIDGKITDSLSLAALLKLKLVGEKYGF